MLALRSHLVVHVKPYSLSFVATPFPSQLIICPLFDVNVLLLRTYKGTDFERNRDCLVKMSTGSTSLLLNFNSASLGLDLNGTLGAPLVGLIVSSTLSSLDNSSPELY